MVDWWSQIKSEATWPPGSRLQGRLAAGALPTGLPGGPRRGFGARAYLLLLGVLGWSFSCCWLVGLGFQYVLVAGWFEFKNCELRIAAVVLFGIWRLADLLLQHTGWPTDLPCFVVPWLRVGHSAWRWSVLWLDIADFRRRKPFPTTRAAHFEVNSCIWQ